MKRFKKNVAGILVTSTILATSALTAYAAPVNNVEIDAVGGWSEETGYFTNAEAYNNAMSDATVRSNPVHTGKKESGKTSNGTSQ